MFDPDSVVAVVAAVPERFGAPHGALSCAGTGLQETGAAGKRTAELDREAWRRMIDVNLTGVWLCIKHQLAVMEKGASSINMASVAGQLGMPTASHYAAAKHGGVGLSRPAAAYGLAGIRVNALCPG